MTTQSSRTQSIVPLGIRRLGTLLGAVLVLLFPAACVLIPQGRDPSAALGIEVRWREGRANRISRSVGVWVDAGSGQIMGAVLERPSAPLDRSETIRPESIVRLSDTPARAPKVVTMSPDSPRFDDPGRFFVAWLQNGSVFRQFCKLNNMRPLSSSLIPTRLTEGAVNISNYDIASSPLDAAVVLATVGSDQRIAVQRISFDTAASDSMRIDELLQPRNTQLLLNSPANITISSVSDASSSSLDVRYLVAWPEPRKIKFLLLGADAGTVRREDQINQFADAVRSAYDPTNQRFLVVYSSGTTISSAIIFPDGHTGVVTTVLAGAVGEIPADTTSTITEGGKRFRVRPYVVHHGREISAVTAIGTATEPRYRIAFWEWLSVAERRQEIIPFEPGGRVPEYPTTMRWLQTTRRLFTLELAQDGHAIGEKRAHGPDFGAGAGALGAALSRDVRTDQVLISPTLPTPALQVEFVP